jgi:hypothetical protein
VPASVAQGEIRNLWDRNSPLESWRMSLISNGCAPNMFQITRTGSLGQAIVIA